MIFENNYAHAGVTAIIYNLLIDHSTLKFYIDGNSNILLPNDSKLIELGVQYKKKTDSDWITIPIFNETILNDIKNGSDTRKRIVSTETDNYLYEPPLALYKWNHMSPVRVVIKNLEEATTYTIRSYYYLSNMMSMSSFNYCDITTLARQNVYYECTEVTGGTEEENTLLQSNINKACDIYNAMTAFTRESPSSSDKLNSKAGGQFTATIVGDTLGGNFVANSDMKFKWPNASIGVICHEMAHNVMKRTIDHTYSDDAYNKIIKFMEFATNCEGASWIWLTNHNYPVISSKDYKGVFNYLVAAACYVCRDASDRI